MLKKIIQMSKGWIILYVVLGMIIQFLTSLNIVFFGQIIDTASNSFSVESIINTCIFYGITLGIICILNYLSEYPRTKLRNSIKEKIRVLSLEKISRIDYLEYHKMGTGEMVKIIENGSDAGKSIIFDFYIRIAFELLPTVVINLLFVSFFNTKIMFVIAIGYIIIFLITKLLLSYLYKVKESLLKKQETMSKYSIRSFMELVVFRVNKQYEKEIKKIDDTADEIINMNCKMTMIHESFFTIFALLITLVKVSVIVIGIYNIVSGDTTIGVIVAMISFIDRIYSPIAIFNVIYIQYKLDKITYKKFNDFYEKPEDKNLFFGKKLYGLEGNISIKNLSFSYGSKVIFKNLTLNISKGSTVAIVGESGGGKSTIAKLILGLIKKQGGVLKIDGNNIDDINLNSYYDYVSYISQDSPVFDATIKENIAFDKNISDDAVYNYLDDVFLKDKVLNLENKLNTLIGERGTQISGGERQRLAFARILSQNRNLIILDEPVSAMDNITEQVVMEKVIDKAQGKTLIIIAHRLQAIQNVDDIIVLKDGNILDQGNFEYLISNCNYFQKLWEKR